MTSGAGMMRFSRGFMRFGKDLPIAPAAMRAQVPLSMIPGCIAPDHAQSCSSLSVIRSGVSVKCRCHH